MWQLQSPRRITARGSRHTWPESAQAPWGGPASHQDDRRASTSVRSPARGCCRVRTDGGEAPAACACQGPTQRPRTLAAGILQRCRRCCLIRPRQLPHPSMSPGPGKRSQRRSLARLAISLPKSKAEQKRERQLAAAARSREQRERQQQQEQQQRPLRRASWEDWLQAPPPGQLGEVGGRGERAPVLNVVRWQQGGNRRGRGARGCDGRGGRRGGHVRREGPGVVAGVRRRGDSVGF